MRHCRYCSYNWVLLLWYGVRVRTTSTTSYSTEYVRPPTNQTNQPRKKKKNDPLSFPNGYVPNGRVLCFCGCVVLFLFYVAARAPPPQRTVTMNKKTTSVLSVKQKKHDFSHLLPAPAPAPAPAPLSVSLSPTKPNQTKEDTDRKEQQSSAHLSSLCLCLCLCLSCLSRCYGVTDHAFDIYIYILR